MKIIKLWEITIAKKGKKPVSFIDHPKEWYFPYILIEQMEWHPIKQYTNDDCPMVTKDDILMVWDWSIWKTATNIEWVIWSTIVAITPLKMNKDYIHYFIKYSKPTILANPKWSGLAHINPDVFWNLQIPLYTLPQQQAIVDEIEKQCSRLDNWLQSLENIKTDLKNYKASVLKSAVEGKLTEQRRKVNKDIEPASVLLEKVLIERKNKREKENPGKKYKEPHKVNIDWLSELPKWRCWINFNTIYFDWWNWFWKRRWENGILTKVLRLADIKNWKITYDNNREIIMTNEEAKKYSLEKNDLLFIRVNWSTELCGRMIIFEENVQRCFCDHFIRVKIPHTLIYPKYLRYFSESFNARNFIKRHMVSSAWQNTINQESLKNMNIPLPPLAEQQQIVQDVEEKLSVVDVVLAAIEVNIKRAKQLKQSILHQAFTGKLISMEDDDQWVTELLAEIERTKAMLAWQKKTKKTKKK